MCSLVYSCGQTDCECSLSVWLVVVCFLNLSQSWSTLFHPWTSWATVFLFWDHCARQVAGRLKDNQFFILSLDTVVLQLCPFRLLCACFISCCSKLNTSETLTVVESETCFVAWITELPLHYYDSLQGLNTNKEGGVKGAHDGGGRGCP